MKFVITTIYEPSEAVCEFNRQMPDSLVVVGDLKTPDDWALPGVVYLGPDATEAQLGWSEFGRVAPVNHYARKNLGYLWAMQSGDAIGESDDDNVPYADYSFPAFEGEFLSYTGATRTIVNQYSWFTEQPVWPRGLPLSRIRESFDDVTASGLAREHVLVGVWQGLADGDPDVDAIYRLTSNAECTFDVKEPVVFSGPAMAPTNSQNTLWSPALYEAMYLPATVSFRYTDILRGLVASAVANSMGLAVGFCGATVRQYRNPHDYVRDFESEIPVYLTAERAYAIAVDRAAAAGDPAEKMTSIYGALVQEGIVPAEELELLAAWLTDVRAAREGTRST